MRNDDRITGIQKAAILLISLGPEKSAAIFKHLKEDEIEELTLEIAKTRSVTPQVKDTIINEFYENKHEIIYFENADHRFKKPGELEKIIDETLKILNLKH